MNTVFIQIRCKPGKTYYVADEIALRETFAELYSTSGDYDLLLKLYIPEGQDTGRFINDYILDIEGIERTHTIMTFKAFQYVVAVPKLSFGQFKVLEWDE